MTDELNREIEDTKAKLLDLETQRLAETVEIVSTRALVSTKRADWDQKTDLVARLEREVKASKEEYDAARGREDRAAALAAKRKREELEVDLDLAKFARDQALSRYQDLDRQLQAMLDEPKAR